MKKRVLSCLMLATSLTTSVFAGSFYIGPSILVQNISASHSSFRGVKPRISGGYADLYCNYYLAGELFVIPTTANLSNEVNPGGTSAKSTSSYGASILPGVLFNERVMGYLRVGAVYSKFTGPNLSKMGAQVGAGLETGLNENWDLRGEYIYTVYKSMNGLESPKSNEVGIGFIYRIYT